MTDDLREAMAATTMAHALAWWRAPAGDPPHVRVPGALFSAGRVWGRRYPMVWPRDLRDRLLVVVAASGGVDSTAAALLAREDFPDASMLLVRSDTGFEPADSDAVLRALARKVRAPTVTLEPPRNLFDLVRWHGRIPNRAFGNWCTETLKGRNLDAFGQWLVWGRRPRTTFHVVGLLATEPKRIGRHLEAMVDRFGGRMLEIPILRDHGVDKARAVEIVRDAGVPLSATYDFRARHGCLPCRWWTEANWRDLWRTDPVAFELAAAVEDEIAVRGPRNPEARCAPGKVLRVWLLGDADKTVWKVRGIPAPVWAGFRSRKAQFPDGATLREWLRTWDVENPRWRRDPPEFGGLAAHLVDPSAEEGAGARV